MTKRFGFKIFIVLFVALAVVASALGVSVSYARWVNEAPTAVTAAGDTGDWTAFYGIVFLDESGAETEETVVLVGDRDAQGVLTGTYTGSFTVDNANAKFKVYYNNKPVTSGLKKGGGDVSQDTADPSVYIAKTATDPLRDEKYQITIAEGAFSVVKTPIDFSTFSDEAILELLGEQHGIVTSTGKIIPLADFTSGESAEIELAAGEELVIMANGKRAKTNMWSDITQYSVVGDNWEKGNGTDVISMTGDGTYIISIKGWLVSGGAKRVHIELVRA